MSYEMYRQSGWSLPKLYKDHKLLIIYLGFIASLVGLAVAMELVGFPTVAGMLISYIVLFSVASFLFIIVPYLLISLVY